MILIDLSTCQPSGHTKFHGGGNYGFIIFLKLITLTKNILVYIDKTKYIPQDVKTLLTSSFIKHVDASEYTLQYILRHNRDIHAIYLPLIRKDINDIVQENSNTKVILTIHGLREIEMYTDKTEYFYSNSFLEFAKSLLKQIPFLKQYKISQIRKTYNKILSCENLHFVTVSNHSRQSIVYNLEENVKDNIPVFFSPSTTTNFDNDTKPYIEEKYYLIISANRWLKNSYRAIKALDLLFSKKKIVDGKVIVVGLSHKSIIYRKIHNKNRFITLPYVEKDILESLYAGAYAFIYPSLNEGFGYPPLEAMKYGVPIVASPFSAISEICSNAVLYANPYSCDEIAMRIIELENKESHASYAIASKTRYKQVLERQKNDLDSFTKLIISFDN